MHDAAANRATLLGVPFCGRRHLTHSHWPCILGPRLQRNGSLLCRGRTLLHFYATIPSPLATSGLPLGKAKDTMDSGGFMDGARSQAPHHPLPLTPTPHASSNILAHLSWDCMYMQQGTMQEVVPPGCPTDTIRPFITSSRKRPARVKESHGDVYTCRSRWLPQTSPPVTLDLSPPLAFPCLAGL